jgi:hypothetical protein
MARTFILAWVIAVLGLVMIVSGIGGVVGLYRQTERAPLKSYGGAISMICGGVGRGAALAFRSRSYSDARRPLSEVSASACANRVRASGPGLMTQGRAYGLLYL